MQERNKRKTLRGKVVSDKMEKTVVVEIERKFPHPIYKKIISRRTRLKAHDQDNQCRVGDKVTIVETRPLSKDKSYRVVEILEKAK